MARTWSSARVRCRAARGSPGAGGSRLAGGERRRVAHRVGRWARRANRPADRPRFCLHGRSHRLPRLRGKRTIRRCAPSGPWPCWARLSPAPLLVGRPSRRGPRTRMSPPCRWRSGPRGWPPDPSTGSRDRRRRERCSASSAARTWPWTGSPVRRRDGRSGAAAGRRWGAGPCRSASGDGMWRRCSSCSARAASGPAHSTAGSVPRPRTASSDSRVPRAWTWTGSPARRRSARCAAGSCRRRRTARCASCARGR